MRGPSTGAQNCREHAGATLAVKPRAGTMQHTALPTMHRPLSHTGTHTHPRSRREPGPRPGPRATGRRPLQPPAYLEVAPAAVPPWRPRWAGARPRAAAASDSGQVSAGAEQRLRAGSGRRLHPRSAPGRRRWRRRQRGGPGSCGARSLGAARSEGAPAPALPLAAARHRRRRPATAPHTSIIHRPSPASPAKPITGGGSANGAAAAEEAASRAPGRKRQPSGDGDGPGARGGRGRTGRASETSHGLRPAPRAGTPPARPPTLRAPAWGSGARGEVGRAAAGGGGGEEGGAREEDERLADLPRRLQGAPARARPTRPPSLAAHTPAPSPRPALTRAQTASPATLLRVSTSEYESEAAHISNLHAGVVLVHAAAELTHRPTGGGGGRAPFPPPRAIN